MTEQQYQEILKKARSFETFQGHLEKVNEFKSAAKKAREIGEADFRLVLTRTTSRDQAIDLLFVNEQLIELLVEVETRFTKAALESI